jgi:hypothetical protein
MARIARALVLAALAATACACQPVVTGTPFEAFTLTPDGTDVLTISGTPDDATATAAVGNTGGNTRAVWWDPAVPAGLDVAACVTWESSTYEPHQPGLALWRPDEGGLTVTRNVWGWPEGPGAYTGLNVHRWDVTHDADGRAVAATFTQLGGAKLAGIRASDGGPKAYPWRVCVVTNWTEFRFKVWSLAEAEPEWGDPAYGYTVAIPADMQLRPRHPAWYDGHTAPGQSARYTDFAWAIVG